MKYIGKFQSQNVNLFFNHYLYKNYRMRYLFFLFLSISISSCGTEEPPKPPTNLKPSVSIDALSILEGDEDKSVFVTARLSKSSTERVTIFVESENGSAEAGSDYVAISESVEFDVGSAQEAIKLDIIGDDYPELNEDLKISIINVSGASLGIATATIIIENDDGGNGGMLNIPDSGYSSPAAYDGWTMIWSDEFDGEKLDESFWTYEIGNGDWGWGNNELEFYRKDNTSIIDGNLVIEAKEEAFNGFDYTSSRIITKDKFEFQFGRVDIRAVLPEGQGIWPALWMLGANIGQVGWPKCGEIDIMELLGHKPSEVHATVHYADPGGERIMKGNSTKLLEGQKFSEEFHVFSIIWKEDGIEFFLDDVKYHEVTRASLGAQNPYPFNDPFFFIFNVAVGGEWPGSPDGTTVFSQHMIVDYIRVFQPE